MRGTSYINFFYYFITDLILSIARIENMKKNIRKK